MGHKIIIWDTDGTIIRGMSHPDDFSEESMQLMPNVRTLMESPEIENVICSGTVTPDSLRYNYDCKKALDRFIRLMGILPIKAASISPAIGGVECHTIILPGGTTVVPSHQEARYKPLIGQFCKPGTGMMVVLLNVLREKFGIESKQIILIGDMPQDKGAAEAFGIPFVQAQDLHSGTVNATNLPWPK